MRRAAISYVALLSLVATACGEPPPPAEMDAMPAAAPTDSLALKAIMADLGEDMGAAQRALWVEDFDALGEAAGAVADHPRVSPGEMARVQATLGPAFPDFAAADRRVHDLAVGLRDAAARRDTAAVLQAFSELQAGCVACHTAFRARLLAPSTEPIAPR